MMFDKDGIALALVVTAYADLDVSCPQDSN